MRKTRRRIGVLLLFVAVITACSGGSGSDKPIDNTLRTLRYELLEGGSPSALASYSGRPVLINFFASWCAPCVAEMPDLETLHKEYGDRVVFLGFATQEKPEDARKLVEKTGVTYQIALDPNGEIFQKFAGLGMPTTVLLRADGTIAELHSGALSADRLRTKIDKAFF